MTNNGFKILLDLDNVICNTASNVLKWVQNEYSLGVGITTKDLHTYNIEEIIPGLSFDMLERIFINPKFWNSINAFQAAKDLSNILGKIGNVTICTDRRWYKELLIETKQWLNNNEIYYDDLVICKGKEKHEFASKNNFSLALEDRSENVTLLSNICPVICMEWPYNRKEISSLENTTYPVHLAKNYYEVLMLTEDYYYDFFYEECYHNFIKSGLETFRIELYKQ